MEQTLLITGGAGFIGSNFVTYLLDKYPAYRVVNLDLLTYAGSLENLKEVQDNSRHHFAQGNICDRRLIESLFKLFSDAKIISLFRTSI